MSNQLPKPHWLRFRLRTLFVVVALLSLPMFWLTQQRKWIEQRHQFLTEFGKFPAQWPVGKTPSDLPWPLLILGEQRVDLVVAPTNQADRAHELFPEAAIYTFQGSRATVEHAELSLNEFYTPAASSLTPPTTALK